MVIFNKTSRSDMDLALTRGSSPFSKETSSRLKSQESQFTFENAEAQRLRELKKQTMQNEKRQKMLFEKYKTVQEKSTTINLDFADRISKVISSKGSPKPLVKDKSNEVLSVLGNNIII